VLYTTIYFTCFSQSLFTSIYEITIFDIWSHIYDCIRKAIRIKFVYYLLNDSQSSIILSFLGVIALFTFSTSNFNEVKGQNYTSLTIKEFESIRTSLDQAIDAFNVGNLSGAYEQLQQTENQTQIVESRILFELGIE